MTRSTRRVFNVYNPDSLGIGRYAKGLAGAMETLGWESAGSAGADLWHVHFGNSSRQIRFLLRPVGAPIVLTVHDVLPRSHVLRLIVGARLARGWKRKAQVTVVHNAYAQQLLGGRVKVLPMHAFSDLQVPFPHTGLRVGVFGRFAAHKNLAWVREALRGLPFATPIHLTLCGQGAAVHGDMEWADVAIVDNPSKERFDSELATMDVVVAVRLDSVGESSALVPQALASGVAVLHNSESASQNNLRGAGVEVNSPRELREVLLRLADDPAEVRRLRATARLLGETVRLPRVAKDYEAVYASALAGRET
jgi:glycosyltransferase involved in cell wall biosynthesis